MTDKQLAALGKRAEKALATLREAGVTVSVRSKSYPITSDEVKELEAQVKALSAEKSR